MITKEDIFKLLNKHQDNDTLDIKTAKEMVNIIFNDHEAQLKEVNRVKEDFRKVALDLDAEASELREQLKAKDEEIERLKGKTQILEVLVDNTKDIIKAQTRMCRTKARSIVAMLFWEWRRDKRIYENANRFTKNIAELYVNCSELSFRKSYKILKDKK